MSDPTPASSSTAPAPLLTVKSDSLIYNKGNINISAAFIDVESIPLQAYDILVNKNGFGDLVDESRILKLSGEEVEYLIAEQMINVAKDISNTIANQIKNSSPSFRSRAYSSLRKRGFVVKSGLKFGADFLIYRGKQGKVHAESAVVLVKDFLCWRDIVGKSRLNASVGKSLVLMDEELNAVKLKRWTRG